MNKTKLLIALAAMLLATNAFADGNVPSQSSPKVVTSSFYFTSGGAVIANEFLNDQEYSGTIMGGGAKFGAMYKRSENVSWDIDITYLRSSYSPHVEDFCIANPARTSFYAVNMADADYGYVGSSPEHITLYRLVAGVIQAAPNHINNIIDFDLQTQFKASAGARYDWFFNKFGLSLQANLSIPFMGLTLSSTKYEGTINAITGGEVLPASKSPLYFTSFHNLTGFNTEIEADLIFSKATLFLALELNNRSWNVSGMQNYRNYSMTRLGIKVDLVSLDRYKSSKRYF